MNHIAQHPGISKSDPDYREDIELDTVTCRFCQGQKQFSLCCGGWIISGECCLCKAKCTPANCSECNGTGKVEDKL